MQQVHSKELFSFTAIIRIMSESLYFYISKRFPWDHELSTMIIDVLLIIKYSRLDIAKL